MIYFQNDYYDFSEMQDSNWIFTAEECSLTDSMRWHLRAYSSLCMREILAVDTYDELIVWADLHNITIVKTVKYFSH